MTYTIFLKYLDSIDKLDKDKYIELTKIFKENTNIYFDKYINKLSQDDYIKNISKFEYYLNINTFHSKVNEKYMDENITMYLKDISKYPILSEQDEIVMLKQINKLKKIVEEHLINDEYLDNTLINYGYNKNIKRDLSSRIIQLKFLKRINAKDARIDNFNLYVDYINLKETFFKCNLRLVVSLLKKRKIKTCDLLDYIQWGNEGLLIAVDKFNPTFNTKFSTYAYYWINCKINLNYFKERKYMKASYGNHLLATQLSNYCNNYYNVCGIYPTKEEKIMFIYDKLYMRKSNGIIKQNYNKCEEKLEHIENIIRYENMSSLDTLIGEDQENSIIDMIQDPSIDVEKEGTDFELTNMFKSLFSNFSDEQVCIILLRNGIGIYKYLSFKEFQTVFSKLPYDKQKEIWKSKKSYKLQEIANMFNVSRQMINVREKKTMVKMKKYKYLFNQYVD